MSRINIQTIQKMVRSLQFPDIQPYLGRSFPDGARQREIALNMKGVWMAVLDPIQGLWTGVSGNSIPGIPITGDMRFNIYSNGKLFTALTLAHLQEQGVLSLDDQMYQWLPSYPYHRFHSHNPSAFISPDRVLRLYF